MNAGVLIATVALTIGPPERSPDWSTDYVAARRMAVQDQRPLAVFFGSGANGFHRVCRDGHLSVDVRKVLFERYQCVYLDVAVPSSKRLAESFAITAGKGLVLSDRNGDYQAFHHDGDLTGVELTLRLQTHAQLAAPAPAVPYVDLTEANFTAEVLESKQPVLVDFHADWCGPCQRMGPVVVALGSDFRGRAKIAKLNTDQNRALVAKYGVSAIPAFLIFQDGQVVDRVVGATSQAALANRLNAILKE